MRIAGLIAGVFLLCAASPPPEPPPIPEILKPYVKDGRLVPGDFGYLRQIQSDASTADEAGFAEFAKWQATCREQAKARVEAELRAMGISDPKIEGMISAPLICRMTSFWPLEAKKMSAAQFEAVRQRAGPLAETYLVAVRQAMQIGGPRGGSLADLLLARPLGEQMLRTSMSWGQGSMIDVPSLTPEERRYFLARLGMEAVVLDYDNTEWLKKIVAEQGWPTISKVGARAANDAWLLVQHADADPAFQLQALRLMEPLVPKGEVSKPNYAYLYDRVMLKLNGKQRYATQMTCEKGNRVPLPLEDETAIRQLRSDMELNALADYIKGMNRNAGPCPPG